MKNYKHFLNENTTLKKLISTGLKFDFGWSDVFSKDGKVNFVSNHIVNKEEAKKSFETALDKTAKKLNVSIDDFETQPKGKGFVATLPLTLVEGFYGDYYSSDANRLAAYSDLSGKERKELDSYCRKRYGRDFMSCTWKEQSGARSVIWSKKEDPDEIEQQNKKDAEF